jgi:hypothetical protein
VSHVHCVEEWVANASEDARSGAERQEHREEPWEDAVGEIEAAID